MRGGVWKKLIIAQMGRKIKTGGLNFFLRGGKKLRREEKGRPDRKRRKNFSARKGEKSPQKLSGGGRNVR